MGVSSCRTESPNSSPALKNTHSWNFPHRLLTVLILILVCSRGYSQDVSSKEMVEPAELSLIEASILGVVEGITEFLPVSSTGHLILTAHFLELSEDTILTDKSGNVVFMEKPSPENPAGIPLTLEVGINNYLIIIQFGAIAAVVFLYWNRLLTILFGILGKNRTGVLLLRNLIVAFIPIAVLGLLFKDLIDRYLFGNLPVVLALFIGGVAILIVDRWHRNQVKDDLGPDLHELTLKQCLCIGVLQCVALWPGTSRSLMAIIGGYLVRLSPSKAAEFSFLLGLVTLSAASIYKGYKVGLPLTDAFGWWIPLLGCLIAAVSAALAVKWMVNYLGKHGLALFGYYRIVLAAVLAVVFYV
jgi:undecaprenyl-diphosphatase